MSWCQCLLSSRLSRPVSSVPEALASSRLARPVSSVPAFGVAEFLFKAKRQASVRVGRLGFGALGSGLEAPALAMSRSSFGSLLSEVLNIAL